MNKEILNEAKNVILGYYSNQNEKIYVPEDILNKVFSLASESSIDIQHFCIYSKDISLNKLLHCILSVEDELIKKISQQTFAINNIRELKESTIHPLIVNSKIKEKNIILLTSIKNEDLTNPFNFILFDSRYALILDPDLDGGYYLTNSNDIINICKTWLSQKMIHQNEIDSFFLQEPLMMSADMVSEVASVLCTHDHMDTEGCYWYHSIWQYLRLMNMVSTPSWHHDFYMNEIPNSVESISNPNILISGAADYSSLSYVIQALANSKKQVKYDVLDLCRTPLFACEWYAKRVNADVSIMQKSIFELNMKEKYDLICTDAFLTRFTKSDLIKILSNWYNALKPNGQIVTTVRIHDDNHICPETPKPENVKQFKEKARKRSKLWVAVINYSDEEIEKKAEIYAQKMHSNCLGTKEDILNAFKSVGFSIEHLEDVEVEGELYPSRYLRLRAKKAEE